MARADAALMPAREYDVMRRAEDRHWWYRALRSLVARELARTAPRTGAVRVLDAGCGTGGGLVRWTRTLGVPCYGIDLAAGALAHCAERGERRVAQAPVEALPFRDEAFDAVVSLDVICLEGIDEARALAEIRRVLRPGGSLILNLPAFAGLRGEHDRAVRIRHRYTSDELARLLRSSGFVVKRIRYWNTALFPVAWVVRRLRRGSAEATSDLAPLPGPLNAALTALLRLEAVLLARATPPFGTSVLAVAMKV